MKRGKRRWRWVAVSVLVVAAGATAGLLLLTGSKAQALRYLTATASKGTIARTVEADFTLSNARDTTTIAIDGSSSTSSSTSTSTTNGTSASGSASSTSSSSLSGVVTGIALAAGRTPHTLEHLLTVSGTPVYAFVSSSPLYENLSTSLTVDTDTANVKALQRALTAGGYYTGTIDGDFGTSTQSALEAWQADQGLTETGSIDTSEFVWVPKGAVLSAWSVSLGSNVSAGTSLASVLFPRPLKAEALVSQADIARLKIGQRAQLTVSGTTSESFTGTAVSIASQPASSSSSGSSSSVEYTVTLAITKLPASVKSGMTGTLVITIAERSNVLLVPTSAIVGSGTSPYVRVMINGKPIYRQVTTGMATSSYTEITSGLTASELVMTGTYSTSSATSSASQSSNSLLTGLSGGSGQAGGLPSGGGAPPTGPGQ